MFCLYVYGHFRKEKPRRSGQSEAIALSYLHRVELYYGLAGKEQRGEIKSGSARVLFELFERHLGEERYFEIPWGLDVVEQSTTCWI